MTDIKYLIKRLSQINKAIASYSKQKKEIELEIVRADKEQSQDRSKDVKPKRR